jgi:hypothetical protein
MKHASPMAEYEPVRQQLATMLTPEMFGDPAATAEAIFKAVDADEPPLHLVLGPLLPMIRQIYAGRLASWEKWEAVSKAAQGSRTQRRFQSKGGHHESNRYWDGNRRVRRKKKHWRRRDTTSRLSAASPVIARWIFPIPTA